MSHQIPKGHVWFSELRKQIAEGNSAILCVTPTNIGAPWLHFEAGAAWKAAEQSVVAPLLFRVAKTKVRLPLSSFQVTESNVKEDVFDLLRHLNTRCSPQVPVNDLEVAHGRAWLPLQNELSKIEDDAPAYFPFENAGQAALWVPCHGTKFDVPKRETFWNSLLAEAQTAFTLIGNSNKSWVKRSTTQSHLLSTAIVRICCNGGKVTLVSNTDKAGSIAPTKAFLDRFVCEHARTATGRKQANIRDALGANLIYSVSPRINYSAVVSDDRAVILPLLNTAAFRDESMVIELSAKIHAKQFDNYCGDIERLIQDAENLFPRQWANELLSNKHVARKRA